MARTPEQLPPPPPFRLSLAHHAERLLKDLNTLQDFAKILAEAPRPSLSTEIAQAENAARYAIEHWAIPSLETAGLQETAETLRNIKKWQDIYQFLIREWIKQDKQALPQYAEDSLRKGFNIAKNMKDINNPNRPLTTELRLHNVAEEIACSANDWVLAQESLGRTPDLASQYDELVRNISATQTPIRDA